jgi:hypothetical protein
VAGTLAPPNPICEILENRPERQGDDSMPRRPTSVVSPSAARLTESLRDIGYDFPSAIADLVDNSIMAGATRVEILIEFDGPDSSICISDNGRGMTANALVEALRYGSRRQYSPGDLGRYGLGLKTASLSQCRSVTVAARSARGARVTVRMLDLDLIAKFDEWLVVDPGNDQAIRQARQRLSNGAGTVVIWRKLDRILPDKRPEGGWARRRLENLTMKAIQHLGMVFHRFLADNSRRHLVITVNGEKVAPWDPFAPDEAMSTELSIQRFEVAIGDVTGSVGLRRYVLPTRDSFSSVSEFERLSGPLNWNRQQGFYIFRANRLVQWGGWNGIRGIDEHTKLARAALDFNTDLDSLFNIDVAKMRVTIPAQLRQMLTNPVNELCGLADATYRKASQRLPSARVGPSSTGGTIAGHLQDPSRRRTPDGTGLALRAAAMYAGEYEALGRIAAKLREQNPEIADALGLNI